MASYCFRPNSPQSIAKGMAVHRYYGDWQQVRYHCTTAADGTQVLLMNQEEREDIQRIYLEICSLRGIDPEGHKPRKRNMSGIIFGLLYVVAAIGFLKWQVDNLPTSDSKFDNVYMAGLAINAIAWFIAIPLFLLFTFLEWRSKRNVGK